MEGNPIFLLISDRSCILTGSESIAGKKLIKNYQKIAIATSVVTIDGSWREWSAYSNAKEVALSYIAVTAGEVKPIWEGNHKRVAGTKGNGCPLAMFKGSQEKPEALQIDFSFPNRQTAVSGIGQPHIYLDAIVLSLTTPMHIDRRECIGV